MGYMTSHETITAVYVALTNNAGGASILATPFAVLILGAIGFVVGLIAGIVGSLIVDCWPKSEPDNPPPILANNNALLDLL